MSDRTLERMRKSRHATDLSYVIKLAKDLSCDITPEIKDFLNIQKRISDGKYIYHSEEGITLSCLLENGRLRIKTNCGVITGAMADCPVTGGVIKTLSIERSPKILSEVIIKTADIEEGDELEICINEPPVRVSLPMLLEKTQDPDCEENDAGVTF